MGKDKKALDPKKLQAKAKEKLVEAKSNLTAFLKTNKLARDEDHSKDKKHGKTFKELNLEIEKREAEMEAANTKAGSEKKTEKKAKKEKSEGGSAGRAQKYDYPEGLTADEKKKFRVAARKGETAGTEKKAKSKKDDAKKSDKKSGGKAEKVTTKTKKDSSEKSGKKKKKKSKKSND